MAAHIATDDDLLALTLQLEELRTNDQLDEALRAEIARELEENLIFLNNQRLATNIGRVLTDENVLEEIRNADGLMEKLQLDAQVINSQVSAATTKEDVLEVSQEAKILLDTLTPHVQVINEELTDKCCSGCWDDFIEEEGVVLACDHFYCHGCIVTLFVHAMNDESSFPPHCCQNIEFEKFARYLSEQQIEAFNNATIEFSTTDRTYCSNALCQKFILPATIHDSKADCVDCHTSSCSICKFGYHDNADCPADTALHVLKELAKTQSWQRCDKCKAMVDLTFGCNHIT
jgi:hypothetical protein